MVRPWARHAGLALGALATLVIFGVLVYVLGMGAIRAIQETDPGLRASKPVPMPTPTVAEPSPTFREPLETSIINDDELPPPSLDIPEQVDAYDGNALPVDGEPGQGGTAEVRDLTP